MRGTRRELFDAYGIDPDDDRITLLPSALASRSPDGSVGARNGSGPEWIRTGAWLWATWDTRPHLTDGGSSSCGPVPPRTGKLAVTRLDGSPHVAPVWVAVDGDGDDARLVFMTSADTIKGKSILRDGRVAVCFDDEHPPFAFVTINGTTTTSTDADESARPGERGSPPGTWATTRPRRTGGATPCRRRWSCGSPRRNVAAKVDVAD